MFTPASATVGVALLVSTTSSVLEVHTPLEIVHLNVTLLPAVNPVTVLTLEAGVVITAPFAAPTILHNPLCGAGLLPANVKFPLLHCSWSEPAFEVVGVL